MPRKPKVYFAGAIYHAMARGVDRRPIFVDDDDRRRFLDQMRRYEKELGAQILAYCLMNNHFHLAIKVGASTLGAFMQRLEGGYAAAFNFRHERKGHLFESRYKDKLCLDERYLLTVIHYIHMNPVRASLVSRPEDWPWSSYEPTDGPFPSLEGFKPWDQDEPPPNLIRTCKDNPKLDEIGELAAAQMGLTIDQLRSFAVRDRTAVSARRQFVSQALLSGQSLAAAARWLGTTRSTVGRYAEESTTQHREV